MKFDREMARKAETALYLVACYVTLAFVLSGCGAQMSMTGAHIGAGFQSAHVGLVVDPSRAQRRGELLPPAHYDRRAMQLLADRVERGRY